MRKIKFRGQTEDGDWLYGDLRQRIGYWPAIIESYCTDEGKVGYREIAVKEKTVGQFTGLHDKDGKEIYEGDIVEMMRKPEKSSRSVLTRHIVTANTVRDWGFESLTKEVPSLSMCNQSDRWNSYKFTVVGNIHDNPELAQEVSLNISERKHRRNSGKVKIEFFTPDATISTEVLQETVQELAKEMSRQK